jgi:hypothetical protein
VGDDDVNPGGQLPDPDISHMQSEFVRAYIEVKDDLGAANARPEVRWDHNLETSEILIEAHWMHEVWGRVQFWSIQIVGAYEGSVLGDYDRNGLFEDAIFGNTKVAGNSMGDDGPSYIYLETIDDFSDYWAPNGNFVAGPTLIRHTVLHESMHHFAGLKYHTTPPGPADQGPMLGTNNASVNGDNRVTPKQLNLLRHDVLPG